MSLSKAASPLLGGSLAFYEKMFDRFGYQGAGFFMSLSKAASPLLGGSLAFFGQLFGRFAQQAALLHFVHFVPHLLEDRDGGRPILLRGLSLRRDGIRGLVDHLHCLVEVFHRFYELALFAPKSQRPREQPFEGGL